MGCMRILAMLLALASLAGARALQDVEFGSAAGQRLLMDAYIPDGAGPFPAAILVHGGAWVTGDKRGTVRPLFDPLAQSGFAWFSINYRLLSARDPAALISPASIAALAGAIEDVRAATEFIRSHASDYNIDPRRVALIGESAGAHLVSMAALKAAPAAGVQAVVAFYSPSDLVALIENSGRIPAALRQAVNGSPMAAMLMAGLRDLSPRTWVRKDAPPFLLVHGTADSLVPYQQSVDMCASLQAAGADCELFRVDGAGHGMVFWNRPDMNAYKQHMVNWLRANLR
jgi:alpha-L-fucosidase 2